MKKRISLTLNGELFVGDVWPYRMATPMSMEEIEAKKVLGIEWASWRESFQGEPVTEATTFDRVIELLQQELLLGVDHGQEILDLLRQGATDYITKVRERGD